jgi:hypothetical protein
VLTDRPFRLRCRERPGRAPALVNCLADGNYIHLTSFRPPAQMRHAGNGSVIAVSGLDIPMAVAIAELQPTSEAGGKQPAGGSSRRASARNYVGPRAGIRAARCLRFTWKHPNAGAVAPDLKQCKTKCILLSTEYAADKPFCVLRHPITSSVLGDLKMVLCPYRQRREGGHAVSAKLVKPDALFERLNTFADYR